MFHELTPFLKEKKMWPLPVGKPMDQWVNEVSHDPKMDQRNKIALFQNEYIYLNQKKKTQGDHASSSHAPAELEHRMETLKAVLLSLDAPVLGSLDVKDAIKPPAPRNDPITPILEDVVLAAWRNEPKKDDGHGNQYHFYDLGGANGNIYRITDPRREDQIPAGEERVAPFILSGVAPREMNHLDAIEYCGRIGARLPTLPELEALGRAMRPGRRYNPDLIADMETRWFWSSSVPYEPDGPAAHGFQGDEGGVHYNFNRTSNQSVRCVR